MSYINTFNNYFDNIIKEHLDNNLDIRLDVIRELTEKTLSSAFISQDERFKMLVDIHYFNPFNDLKSLIQYSSELIDELKMNISSLNCSLTYSEVEILILLFKKNIFPIFTHFFNLKVNLKVDFKIIDANNLITDDNYLNNVDRH